MAVILCSGLNALKDEEKASFRILPLQTSGSAFNRSYSFESSRRADAPYLKREHLRYLGDSVDIQVLLLSLRSFSGIEINC